MKILLTGNDLTIEKVWSVAVEGIGVEISPEADAKLEASRQLVYDLVDEDVPVYGFNTGVGWNKDHTIAKEFFEDFNRKLIYSHSLGIAPEASEAEVRAMMLIRLNCLLQGYTGIQPAVARRYAEFLNEGIHPVVPERGSVGEGDIAVDGSAQNGRSRTCRSGAQGRTCHSKQQCFCGRAGSACP